MDCRHSLWSAFLVSRCRARSDGVRRGATRALIGVGRTGNGSPRKFKRCGRSRIGDEAMARAEQDGSRISIGRGGAADGMVRAGICVTSASIASFVFGLALVKIRLDSNALTVFFMDCYTYIWQNAARTRRIDGCAKQKCAKPNLSYDYSPLHHAIIIITTHAPRALLVIAIQHARTADAS